MKKDFEKIGNFDVDAGICWIGDPCYILHPGQKPKSIGKNWREFCDKLNGITNFTHDLGHGGLGLVIPTGYGDGTYPVYVKRDKEGRISQILIDFEL